MLERYLQKATYPIVLTGAGMSTESGIPDFRGKNDGRWNQKDPMLHSSVDGMNHHYETFLSYQRKRIQEIHQATPHEGYVILTKWQEQGIIKRILTQNVDRFHEKASAKNVIELHGNVEEVVCMSCYSVFSSSTYLQPNGDQCFCGGRIRPNVVLFGEPMTDSVLEEADEELEKEFGESVIQIPGVEDIQRLDVVKEGSEEHAAVIVEVKDNMIVNQVDDIVDEIKEIGEEKGIDRIIVEIDEDDGIPQWKTKEKAHV